MTRISWTLQALDDVESIRRYVARDSEEYASLLVSRFLQAVERLSDFPVSGRITPVDQGFFTGSSSCSIRTAGVSRSSYCPRRTARTKAQTKNAARTIAAGSRT